MIPPPHLQKKNQEKKQNNKNTLSREQDFYHKFV